MKYKVVIVETMFGKQFSTTVDSESEKEAIHIAKQIFVKEYPYFSAHYRVLWCNNIIY